MNNYNPYALSGKKILITGASSGIGRSTAIECSKLGAQVIITARNEERLQETYSLLFGSKHQMILCNLDSNEEIQNIVVQLPNIDGLVNNAGITITKPILFITADSLNKVFNTNTLAPILLLNMLLRLKKLTKGSSVVFTSSIAALGKVSVGNSIYASSKGAVSAFIQGAAKELAPLNIRVNTVCPGMVDTGILNSNIISTEQLEKNKSTYLLKRFGKPQDIAFAIIYLLSDASAWVTGTQLVIDGGRSLI